MAPEGTDKARCEPRLVLRQATELIRNAARQPGNSLFAAGLVDEVFASREQGAGTRILMTRHLDRIGDAQVFRFVETGPIKTISLATRPQTAASHEIARNIMALKGAYPPKPDFHDHGAKGRRG